MAHNFPYFVPIFTYMLVMDLPRMKHSEEQHFMYLLTIYSMV